MFLTRPFGRMVSGYTKELKLVGGGFTPRRGPAGHGAQLLGSSCWLLAPQCVVDTPPLIRDFFCSIKGIITNCQESTCCLPVAQPTQQLNKTLAVSRAHGPSVPGAQAGVRSAKRLLDGDIKMMIFCTKACIQFQACELITQPVSKG